MSNHHFFKQEVCGLKDENIYVRSFRGKKYRLCNDKYQDNIKNVNIGDTVLVERQLNQAQCCMVYYLIKIVDQESTEKIGAKI